MLGLEWTACVWGRLYCVLLYAALYARLKDEHEQATEHSRPQRRRRSKSQLKGKIYLSHFIIEIIGFVHVNEIIRHTKSSFSVVRVYKQSGPTTGVRQHAAPFLTCFPALLAAADDTSVQALAGYAGRLSATGNVQQQATHRSCGEFILFWSPSPDFCLQTTPLTSRSVDALTCAGSRGPYIDRCCPIS